MTNSTKETDPIAINLLVADMPEIADGENWADLAVEAWSDAFAHLVDVEQIETELAPEHVYDGKTAAYVRIGAEWYSLIVWDGAIVARQAR